MNAFDVTGFVPADAGYVLCQDCAHEAGYDIDDPDAGGAVFASSEWDTAPSCDECGERIECTELNPGENMIDNGVFAEAEKDPVGRVMVEAWKAARKQLAEIDCDVDLNIDDLLVTWVRRLRLNHSSPKENVVVCEIEVSADTGIEAVQQAADLMYKSLCEPQKPGGVGLYFTAFTHAGNHQSRVQARKDNVIGPLLARDGITVTGNGYVYAALPEIHVADYADEAEHVRENTNATLDLKSLLESLDDDHLRSHVEWRTPEADFGRTVARASADRREHARQRPRVRSP